MSEEQTQTQEAVVSEVEKEARAQGWVPKEEFRGSENDWIDADTFVQRGKEINPILKKNNERLLKELDRQKREVEELRAATEEFKQFQREQFERKKKDLENQIIQLKEQKKQAITSGDGDLAVELDEKLDALKEERQEAEQSSKVSTENTKETSQEIPPEVSEWIDTNSWYRTDQAMAAVANAEAEKIKRIYPHLSGKEFFTKLDEALEQVFTNEKLGRKKKPRSPVEPGSSVGGNQTGKQSYDNLPSDAKAACDRFVKQKIMTRDEYVAMYQWE